MNSLLQEFVYLKQLDVGASEVTKCIKGSQNYSKYFQFIKRETEEKLPSKIGNICDKPRIDSNPVAKYFNGKLIAVYNSLLEASNKTGISIGIIADCCNKGFPNLGFEFRYLNDILNQEENESTTESTITT